MQRALQPRWVSFPSYTSSIAATPGSADPQIDLFASIPFLPGNVRLNLEDWDAGDVILFRASGASIVHRSISAYQSRAGVSRSGSEVVHVAIYDGCGCLWDARPRKNVQQTAIWRLARNVELARVRLLNARPDTDRLHRALASSKKSIYSVKLISHLVYGLALRQLRFGGAKSEDAEKAAKRYRELTICSTFVERVLVYSTDRVILDSNRVALPGDFVDDARFTFESLTWSRC